MSVLKERTNYGKNASEYRIPNGSLFVNAIGHESPGSPLGVVGGAALITQRFTEELALAGMNSRLLTPNPKPVIMSGEVVTFEKPPALDYDDLCSIYGTKEWLMYFRNQLGHSDVNILHYYTMAQPLSMLRAFRTDQRNQFNPILITQFHTIGELTRIASGRPNSDLRRANELQMTDNSDGILFSTSSELTDYIAYLEANYGRTFAEMVFNKSLYVPLAVDHNENNPELRGEQRNEIRETYFGKFAGDGTKIILAGGRIDALKGQREMAVVFTKMLRENPSLDAALFFIGDPTDGEYYDNIQAAIQEQVKDLPENDPNSEIDQTRIKERIKFLGSHPLAILMRGADIFFTLSKSESFHLALLEAMAQGLATVASSIKTHQEITSNSGTVLVPINDMDAVIKALLFLIDNPRARNDLGELNYKKAQMFQWDLSTGKLITGISSLKVA